MRSKTVTQVLLASALVLAVTVGVVAPAGATPATAAAQAESWGRVRFVHASADSPAIQFSLDGQLLATGLTFGQATDYFALPAGAHTVQIGPSGPQADPDPSLQATLALEAGQAITAVVMGARTTPELNAFRDDLSPLQLGTGRLVVIHAAIGVEAVDVLTADGATLVGGEGQGKASPPVELSVGAYDLEIAATGGDGTALSGSGVLHVNTGTLHTILVLDGGSLTLTAPTLPAQEGAARLRLAHASPDAPAVDVYLNGVQAVSGLAFGSATESLALPPGDYAVAFYEAGAATEGNAAADALVTAALTLGADEARTLVALGDLSALQLVAFTENTTPPTAGNARLTAIHALPSAPAVNLSLPDGTALVENLAFAGQSVGVELPPGAYDLTVSDAESGAALMQLSRTALIAGRAYTVIVVPSPLETQIVQPLLFWITPVGQAPTVAAAPEPTTSPEAIEPTEEPTEAGPMGQAIGLVDIDEGAYLNVRHGPGLNFDPKPGKGLPAGVRVRVVGRDPSSQWLYIIWEPAGQTPLIGWVFALYIRVTIGGQEIPLSDLPLAIGGEEETPGAPAYPAQGSATFTINEFNYSGDGRQAFMYITVTNHSLWPAVASGNWYPNPNPDGGRQWVTLLGVQHWEVPIPLRGDAPLWEFIVTTEDGLVFSALAGCRYQETIFAEGIEPTAEGGFPWSQTLEGGWFDCGNAYRVKPPADLLPGESATVPLIIYLVHPRAQFDDPNQMPQRRIVRLDFIPYAPDGTSFGVQDSLTLP